jgi:hypothetical protein
LVLEIVLGDLPSQAGIFLVLDHFQAEKLKVGAQGHHGLNKGFEAGKFARQEIGRAFLPEACNDHGIGEVEFHRGLQGAAERLFTILGRKGLLGRDPGGTVRHTLP